MKTTLLAALLIATTTIADDRIRDAQAELKQQGFYFGEVDGRAGPETSAAIRRYQIRNGLKVTGDLNAETLDALGFMQDPKPAPTPEPPPTKPTQVNPPPAPARNPAPPPQPQPQPAPDDTPPLKPARDFLRDPAPADDAEIPRPSRVYPPEDPAYVPPPTPIPSPLSDDYSTFYHGTPYATAPREVQRDILVSAQHYLGRRALYNGPTDGIPSPATSEAIFAYQKQRGLRRTGRLDLATLAALDLLPGRGPDAPPLRPFYDPGRRRDRTVDFESMRRY